MAKTSLEMMIHDADRSSTDTEFARTLDAILRMTRNAWCGVPGVQPYEEAGYWRDVGTIDALAAAQNDVLGFQPRFNIRNHQWPIRGESYAQLLTKIRDSKARSGSIDLPADAVAARLKPVKEPA